MLIGLTSTLSTFILVTTSYVGPGIGLGAITAFFGLLFALIFAFFGIIWYPVKRIYRKFKPKQHPKNGCKK